MILTVIKDNNLNDHILICFKEFLEELSIFDGANFGFEINSFEVHDLQKNINILKKSDYIVSSSFLIDIRKYLKQHTKVIFFWDDIHYHTEEALKSRLNMYETCDYLLLPYYKQFLKRVEFKRFWHKAIFFPWFASKKCFEFKKEFEERKEKILISGRISRFYPFRQQLFNYFKNDDTVEFLEHPGYDRQKRKHLIIREDYYKFLSEYKIAVATTARKPLDYTVAKYFEISACGCVPVLQKTLDLEDLGFIENYHYISIEEDNFKNLKNIFNNYDLKKISENAISLINEKHLIKHRIEFLLKMLN